MSRVAIVIVGAVAAGAAATGLAVSSGGMTPPSPQEPAPGTVVAHGTGGARVAEPGRETNVAVERTVDAARVRAIPRAVTAARKEAERLAAAAGLTLGAPVGIARDVAPPGWYEDDTGRFGPGRWCGRFPTRRSGRVRFRHGCRPPERISLRVAVTFATG